MYVLVPMIVSMILQSSRWWIFRVGIPHTTWCICCSQYAHNFVMRTGTPHLCTHARTLISKIIVVSHYFDSIALPVCIQGYITVTLHLWYHFCPIFSFHIMESQPPALPELGGVPALPPFPQEAPEEHPIKQEGAVSETWIIEGTDNVDDAGICYKNAFYVLLKEWFRGRDYTCTLLTKQKYEEILKFCLNLIDGANCRTLYIAGNKQVYKWAAKYDAIVVGEESAVLVLCPTKGPIADAQLT
jgi:hypothetical protein